MKTLLLICIGCLIAAITQAQIIHVPADYPTIQQGIDAATNGDTVLVSDGTYYEQINFLGKKPLMVASQFIIDGDTNHIANTIIDGSQLNNPDSASVVYFISDEDTTSVICGFTIRNGHGTKNYQFLNVKAGGGIFCKSGASILNNIINENEIIEESMNVGGGGVFCVSADFVNIKGNIISHNIIKYIGSGSAATMGGGIFGFMNNLGLKIIDNIIEQNEVHSSSTYEVTGGGAFTQFTKVYYENNRFVGNKAKSESSAIAYGGGLELMDYGANSYIGNNSFINNYADNDAGGIGLIRPYTNEVVVENNFFINNTSMTGGGLSVTDAKVRLLNNVLKGNHAIHGGAIIMSKSPSINIAQLVIMINNSFSGNKASGAGGAIHSINTNPIILNSIFWADTANNGREIYLTSTDTVELAYSNINTSFIQGGYLIDGGGNINEDPLFDDLELLTLSNGSPCINTGTEEYTCHCNNLHTAPAYDIVGNLRPLNDYFEMGAYERLMTGTSSPLSKKINDWHSVYPNPFTDQAKLSYELDQKTQVEINLYNSNGELIQTLLSEPQGAGKQELQFSSGKLPTGIYFYRITTEARQATGRMILMK